MHAFPLYRTMARQYCVQEWISSLISLNTIPNEKGTAAEICFCVFFVCVWKSEICIG